MDRTSLEEKRMLGYYNYTVILTYISLISSFFGMCFALNGSIKEALFCLLFSGMCDMFDGPIARTKTRTKEEKEFGIQIDSLVDLVCFGVFPAIIGYALKLNSVVHISVLALYILAAVIRLSYFNVQESIRQSQTNGKREFYQGLPVTSSALIFPMLYSFCLFFEIAFKDVYFWSILIVGILFISNFKIKKAGKKEMGIMMVLAFASFIIMCVK